MLQSGLTAGTQTDPNQQQTTADILAALLTPQSGQNTPSTGGLQQGDTLSMYKIDIALMGSPDKEDLDLAESFQKNAEALENLKNFDPNKAYLQSVELLKDPESPIAKFMTSLGIRLEDPSIENLQKVTDRLNSEIVSYLTDLKKKREKLSNESPYKHVMDLLMAVSIASPENMDKIGGLLMVLAPKIKENNIRALDEEILKISAAQSDLAFKSSQISSLAENRKLNIARFVGDTALKLTRMDFDKLKALSDEWLNRYKARLNRLRLGLQEKQTRDRTALAIFKQYIAYENILMRHMERITPLTPEGRAARLQMLDRLYRANVETKELLKGTGYENLIPTIDQNFITTLITAPSTMDFLAPYRRDLFRSQAARNWQEIQRIINDINIDTTGQLLNIWKVSFSPTAKASLDRYKSYVNQGTINFAWANETQAKDAISDAYTVSLSSLYIANTLYNMVANSVRLSPQQKTSTLSSSYRMFQSTSKALFGGVMHKAYIGIRRLDDRERFSIDNVLSAPDQNTNKRSFFRAVKAYADVQAERKRLGIRPPIPTLNDESEDRMINRLIELFEGNEESVWVGRLSRLSPTEKIELNNYLEEVLRYGANPSTIDAIAQGYNTLLNTISGQQQQQQQPQQQQQQQQQGGGQGAGP